MRWLRNNSTSLPGRNAFTLLELLLAVSLLSAVSVLTFMTFATVTTAWKKGMAQDVYMKDLMQQHDFATMMNDVNVDDLLHSIFKAKDVLRSC